MHLSMISSHSRSFELHCDCRKMDSKRQEFSEELFADFSYTSKVVFFRSVPNKLRMPLKTFQVSVIFWSPTDKTFNSSSGVIEDFAEVILEFNFPPKQLAIALKLPQIFCHFKVNYTIFQSGE